GQSAPATAFESTLGEPLHTGPHSKRRQSIWSMARKSSHSSGRLLETLSNGRQWRKIARFYHDGFARGGAGNSRHVPLVSQLGVCLGSIGDSKRWILLQTSCPWIFRRRQGG